MQVGLIDVDRRSFPRMTFPNLAMMKISAAHKKVGDTVSWCENEHERFDVVYMSKVLRRNILPICLGPQMRIWL